MDADQDPEPDPVWFKPVVWGPGSDPVECGQIRSQIWILPVS